jgi:hypothetical protein
MDAPLSLLAVIVGNATADAQYPMRYPEGWIRDHAWKWTKWVREVLTDMGFGQYVQKPTFMFGDNRNARDWAIEMPSQSSNARSSNQSACSAAENQKMHMSDPAGPVPIPRVCEAI